MSTKIEIEQILTEAFSPLSLEVIDDTAAHRGHREAREHPGAGHFRVHMKSEKFNGLNSVARHRLVYQQLQSLMDEKIHALSLTLLGSDE